MSQEMWIPIVLALGLLVLAVVALFIFSKRKSQQLRTKFGPEYDHTVGEVGDRRRAEEVLKEREARVQQFHIRPLAETDRMRFADNWRNCQARFVDSPASAVAEADHLCAEVMRARGYPMSDFDQRAADLSVDHPRVVENYRLAHEIAQRHDRGAANMEDLRTAMLYYRLLFEDLLEMHPVAR